jgi:hypothetical protein
MKKLATVFLAVCAVSWTQTTVTLNGTSYTVKGHPRVLFDGPGGVLDSRVKDPDGLGPLKAPKAVASNPAWVALGIAVAGALPVYASNAYRVSAENNGGTAMQFAAYWYGDNSQTAAHDAALYMLNNIEQFVPMVCVEATTDCVVGGTGYGITSYGIAYWAPNWVMAFEMMQGEMTATQRQAFAAKMLNDNAAFGGIDGAPTTSCTNPTQDSGATVSIGPAPSWNAGGTLVSLTLSRLAFTATLTGSTAGIVANNVNQITVSGLPAGNGQYPVLAVTGPHTFTFGYANLPDGDYTAGATLQYSEPYATASTPVFGTTVNSGDWIFTYLDDNHTSGTNLGVVDTIVDSTHAFMMNIPQTGAAQEMYFRPRNWSAGQCGFVWHVKHDLWTPTVITNSGGHSLYSANGGLYGGDTGHNLVYSAAWGLQLIFLSVLDSDANAAVRSGSELTAVYNWWYSGPYALAERFWTGFHQSGSGYGVTRAAQFMPGTAIAIQGSLVNPPNLTGGVWARNVMVLNYANTFPNAQSAQMQWGQPDVSGAPIIAQNLDGFVMLAYWFRNSPEGQYANWWLQNLWSEYASFGNTPGSNLTFTANGITGGQGVGGYYNGIAPAWWFIFTDQSYPTATLLGSPDTFLFNATDTGTAGQRADALISRTGFLSSTDTLLNFHAESLPEFDHNVFASQPSNYGSYKIFKGHYLLAEDFYNDFNNPTANGFTNGGTMSNYVEVGGTQNNINAGQLPTTPSIPRAAGNNSYAYAMADVSSVYLPAAKLQHGFRHLTDFKKPGTQQFIVDFVDFQTSAGATKKAYFHYANMSTTTISGNVVTSNNAHGNISQLITQVLTPQPVLIAQDTSGSTFRVDVCPSLDGVTCDATNTVAEMMVVHMPAAGSGNSLPPIAAIPTIDANFNGVEIDGSSPKVGIFARHGKTYTACSFTAAHSGTAQILIAGISPTATSGMNYSLLLNGTPVLQHQSVGADASFYYEGGPGAYQLVAEAAPPKVAAIDLASASQYQSYAQTLTAVGGTLPLSWSVTQGALPSGLSLNPASGIVSGIPVGTGSAAFTVQVTDALGNTDIGSGSILVNPAPALQITTAQLAGKAGFPISLTLAATGGGGGYQWSLVSGSLPAGFSLNPSGVISGTTSFQAGGTVRLQVTDAYGNTAQQPLEIAITATPATSVTGAAVRGVTILR